MLKNEYEHIRGATNKTCYYVAMKVLFNNTLIAEAPKEDLIKIEGNWYFPPDSVVDTYFSPTDHHTTCFWKGEASYYTVCVADQEFENGAWYYPEPMDGAVRRVGKDFSNYVAFYPQFEIVE